MRKTINFDNFCDTFTNAGRQDQFSYEAKKALFEYLENYETETETEIDLDVIALCCEYCEYKSFGDFKKEYQDIEDFNDLENNTTVIYTNGYQDEDSAFIIQSF